MRMGFEALVAPPFSAAELAEAAVVVGSVVRPDLDVVAGLSSVRDLVGIVDGSTPLTIAASLFGSGRLRGNAASYYDPDNSVLPTVVDTGVGIPISLSVVFIEVARMSGHIVEGVGMPGHFLTKAGDVFIDPFHQGAALTARECEALYQRMAGRPVALPAGSLDPTPPVSIIERMLWNLRSIAEGRNDTAMAERCLALMSALPAPPLQIRLAWAHSLAGRGRFDHAASEIERALESAPPTARDRLQSLADGWAARLN